MTDLLDKLDTTSSSDVDNANDPLALLVGPDKKFKTPVDLAKGKLESDRFINQLQDEKKKMMEEMSRLQEEAQKKVTMTEILNELRNSNTNSGANQPQGSSVDEILKVVDTRLSEREQERIRFANRTNVNTALLAKFNGDEQAALRYVAARARELSLTNNQLTSMSEESPTAFLHLIGIAKDAKRDVGSPTATPDSKVNSEAITTSTDGVRNQKYYQELRRKMGVKAYFGDFALQKQLYKDMDSQGDSFFE